MQIFSLNICKLKVNDNDSGLRKKCPYSEVFWSAFLLHFPAFGLNSEISPYSARMRKNAGKMRTRVTPNRNTFYTVLAVLYVFNINPGQCSLFVPLKTSGKYHSFDVFRGTKMKFGI